MTEPTIRFPDSTRPAEMTARMSRSGRAKAAGHPRQTIRVGAKRFALLAVAIALPAMANSGDWSGGGEADAETVAEVMPFETPNGNFPGSAFYYLEDTPYVPAGAENDGYVPTEQAKPSDTHPGLDAATPGAGGPAARALAVIGDATTRARAMECMTMAIYYEAASESDAGQRAVAQVVLNRVAHRSYPGSVCGVVFQGSERRTGCQFSFTCDGSLRRQPSRIFWARAQRVARAALAGAVYDPVGLSTHYHTTAINPYWAPSLDHVTTIGAHRFYRMRGGAGQSGAFRFAHGGLEPAARPNRSQPSEAAPDPVALSEGRDAAAATASPATQAPRGGAARPTPTPSAPAPDYSDAVRERGGDRLYDGSNLPQSGAVRPEYAGAGQWLDQR